MVLSIIPPSEINTDPALWVAIKKLSLKFLGYLISFGIVGHYWTVHHRIFGYVNKYDTTLIWLNMGYLFTVALLPFSSALLGDYSTGERLNMVLPYFIYVVNICMVAFFNVVMWMYVSNPRRSFLTHIISPLRIRLGVYRSLILPGIFLVSFFLSYPFPVFARFIPLSIPLIIHFGMKGIEKRVLINEIEMEKAADTTETHPPETVLA